MTRVLALLVALELIAGGVLVYGRFATVLPPRPSNLELDSATLDELRTLAQAVRSAESWAAYGDALLAVGCYPEAEACLHEARRLDPTSAEIAYRHGFALERLGAAADANEAYRAALGNGFSRKSDAHYHIGRNHLRLEDATAAAKAFADAGTLPGARLELARLDARAGRVADAETEQLAAAFPDAYPPVSLRLRLAMVRSDRAAVGTLSEVFASRRRPLPTPFDAEVDRIMSRANGVGSGRLFRDAGREMNAGRAEAAEAKLRSALDARWQPEIADKLAEVAFARGRRGDARKLFAEIVERGGPNASALWRLGQAEDAAGAKGRALASWRRGAALATGPTGRDLFQDLAGRLEKDGNAGEAKAAFLRSLLAAGMESLDAGQFDEARRALDRAVQVDATSAAAWQELGDARRRAGLRDDARTAYERALQLDADNGRAIRGLERLAN